MKILHILFLFALVGPLAVCLAEEEAPLRSTEGGLGAGREEDEVVLKLAELQQAASVLAAADQEAVITLEEKLEQVEEKLGQQESNGMSLQVGTEDDEDAEADAEEHKAEADGEDAGVEAVGHGAPGAEAAKAMAPEVDAVDIVTGNAIEEAVDEAASKTSGLEAENEDEAPTAPPGGGALGTEADNAPGAGDRRRRAVGRQLDGFIDGWRGALGSYDGLLKRHYLKMSFGQATALGVMGDTIAQRLERRLNPGQRYELKRTLHAGILNMIIDGVFTPRWYNLVDSVNSEMTLAIAFVKAITASVFYGPFANGLFLAGARTLRYGLKGRRFDWREWMRQLKICTIRDFEMWPPLHILNFWLVPKHWRPLAGHLAGVVLLAVISSTDLTDESLPFGQRAVPLMICWAKAICGRLGGKGRRATGAPPVGRG